MKIALNGATTMSAGLESDIHVASAAGFDFLEIWAAKLRSFLHHRTSRELNKLLAESGVPPLSINSIEHITFRDAPAYESIKEQCSELSRIAATIKCPFIVVVPGRVPSGGVARAEVISESVRV
jgi:sugar phosphate isomerase/epimerase